VERRALGAALSRVHSILGLAARHMQPAPSVSGQHQRETRGGLGFDGDEAAVHEASWFDVLGSFERQDG